MNMSRIHKRIVGKGRGAIFAPATLDICSRDPRGRPSQPPARSAPGPGALTTIPINPRFGPVAPPADDVAGHCQGQPCPADSPAPPPTVRPVTQVPAGRYRTDGPTRTRLRQAGHEFRNAAENLVGAGQKSGACSRPALSRQGQIDDRGGQRRARWTRGSRLLLRQSRQVPPGCSQSSARSPRGSSWIALPTRSEGRALPSMRRLPVSA